MIFKFSNLNPWLVRFQKLLPPGLSLTKVLCTALDRSVNFIIDTLTVTDLTVVSFCTVFDNFTLFEILKINMNIMRTEFNSKFLQKSLQIISTDLLNSI